MTNILARIDKGTYLAYAQILKEHHGFVDCYMREKRKKRIKSFRELIWDTFCYTGYIIRHFRTFRNTEVIVGTGFLSIVLKGMIRFRLISCKRFIWLGFQLHNPKYYPLFRKILKFTQIPQEIYLLNAAYEADIYEKEVGISAEKMQTLQYSDWGKSISPQDVYKRQSDYYFAGGYTNRDYAPVISTFRKNGLKLVIVGSALNKGLTSDLPENITVLKDIPKQQFNELLRNAKACILPMKNLTGASGQMVLLNYMKNGKPIIASDVPSVTEYVEGDRSALLYQNGEELEACVEELERSELLQNTLGLAAIKSYQKNFSRDVLADRFSEIIEFAAEQEEKKEAI